MAEVQTGILAPVPRRARYLSFTAVPNADLRAPLAWLAAMADGETTVVGLGDSLVRSLGRRIEGQRSFSAIARGRRSTVHPRSLVMLVA